MKAPVQDIIKRLNPKIFNVKEDSVEKGQARIKAFATKMQDNGRWVLGTNVCHFL
jgi:hypothetical protein